MRSLAIFVSFACAGLAAKGTTLRQMSLTEMAQKASVIVRATITASSGVVRGTDVYTAYRLKTLQTLKSGRAAEEVAVPGGVAGELRQVVNGAPVLHIGGEYVLFLWADRSGLIQLMGMSQGLFSVVRTANGDVLATRAAAGEQMLNPAGQPVHGAAESMPLAELQTRIAKVLKRDRPAISAASGTARAK